MEPKQIIITIVILNIIFFGVFYWLAQTAFFDRWLSSKFLPNLCIEEQEDRTVFVICPESKQDE